MFRSISFQRYGQGMSNKRIDKAITDFIVIPVILLTGLYVTASFIDSMLHLNNETFKILFTGIGGILCLILHFKAKIKEL